ncbi:MAG: malto-oligosyltrehalose synthase, partial [Thermomicrobiales bacterium]
MSAVLQSSDQTTKQETRRYAPPIATYRVQLHAGFPFEQARALVPYFARLGISHFYCSPIFTAAPGSTHGYDVVNHNQVNPELGGLPALYALSETLFTHDMGLIVDIVPNHVGLATSANPWWRDVLRFGPASPYAPYFDINWSTQPHLPSGVLVYPILGQPFGAALEAGELRLRVLDDDLWLCYYDHRLPLAPRTYQDIIGLPPVDLRGELNDPASLADILGVLEGLDAAPPEEADGLLARFRQLLASEPALARYIERRLAELNGTPGEPATFDRLEAILARQHYRLSYWRVSGEDINYRRFFDINELAAIRVERENVFVATHQLLQELVRQDIVTGVRVDHVDGLFDPAGYLLRLRAWLDEASTGHQIPIWVEKIVEEGEALPADWPVAGTTGYDFMAHTDGLFIDRGTVVETTRTYERFVEGPVRFRQLRYDARRQIARTAFAGEINVLAMQLHAIAQRSRWHRDHTLRALRNAIEAVLATFPVYRTYIVGAGSGPQDRANVEAALVEARRRELTLSPDALDFLAEVLLLDGDKLDAEEQERRRQFRRRFQQLSSPVMAKGFEDTAFYRYNRLVSLNEVGSDPALFGSTPDDTHAWFATRARDWPHAMSASSTHDTKRSEDARARLHVLSEIPREWRREALLWARINRKQRGVVHGESVPDPNTEYLLYQNLIASWPDDGKIDDDYRTRLEGYLVKAMREMKTVTSWTNVDEVVEEAACEFLRTILDRRRSRTFQRRVTRLVANLAPSALLNSLAMLLVKATAPGFPDFYQGAELWNRRLTDPDNRQPVDYECRQALLATVIGAVEPPADLSSPAMKLWLTQRLLALRAAQPSLFACGDYRPLTARGAYAANVFAFARTLNDVTLVVAVPRLTIRIAGMGGPAPLGALWRDTTLSLPADVTRWRDALTGASHAPVDGTLACADLFDRLPFAVLLAAR